MHRRSFLRTLAALSAIVLLLGGSTPADAKPRPRRTNQPMSVNYIWSDYKANASLVNTFTLPPATADTSRLLWLSIAHSNLNPAAPTPITFTAEYSHDGVTWSLFTGTPTTIVLTSFPGTVNDDSGFYYFPYDGWSGYVRTTLSAITNNVQSLTLLGDVRRPNPIFGVTDESTANGTHVNPIGWTPGQGALVYSSPANSLVIAAAATSAPSALVLDTPAYNQIEILNQTSAGGTADPELVYSVTYILTATLSSPGVHWANVPDTSATGPTAVSFGLATGANPPPFKQRAFVHLVGL